MKLLVYGLNFRPELTGIGAYTGQMVRQLRDRGHDVCVVTSQPYYPEWKMHAGFPNRYAIHRSENLRVFRCPIYVPESPRALSRILHLLSFAISSLPVLLRLLFWRPQAVVLVVPTMFCAPATLLFAFLSRARSVLHIQDFELDAMFGLGLMQGKESGLARGMRTIEGFIMRRFDRVSTISQSMIQHAVKKGVPAEKTLFFPNWVDTDFIHPGVDRMKYRQAWGIPDATRVVLYSGNMGRKQGLEMVVEAAARFRGREDVLFILVGQGAARSELEAQAQSLGLRNIRFEPLQPYEDLPTLLVMADVHLVVQKRGAADVVLPSKLTGILSAGGHALITAEAQSELGLLVAAHPGIAEIVEPETLDGFCGGLERLLLRDTKIPNPVARDYAMRFLNRDAILTRFDQDLAGICAKRAV